VFKPQTGIDINFALVEQHIIEMVDHFELKEVWYDPYQAESMAQWLRAAGVNMVAFPQTPANLEDAASNLLRLVSERNIVTYESPELRTAIGNCRSIETIRGFRISKIAGSRKIDLAAALSFAARAAVKGGQHAIPGFILFTKAPAEEANRPQTPGQAPPPIAMTTRGMAVICTRYICEPARKFAAGAAVTTAAANSVRRRPR
jgi:hypothetical protein